jgi:hypothetical protein
MAFTRSTYDRLGYEEALRCALTDDLVLQKRTQRAGEQTGFTPGGMVISEPVRRFMDFFRWAVRQSRMIRMVTPWLYLMGFATANVYACFYGMSLTLLSLPDTGLDPRFPAGALAAATVYYLGRGYMDYKLATLLFPRHLEKTASLRWVYYWANPLSDLVAPFVAYASLLSNRIRWRGISYEVKGGRVVRASVPAQSS